MTTTFQNYASNALAPTRTAGELHPVNVILSDKEREELFDLAMSARSVSTRRVYNIQFKTFCEWCAAHGACPLPASPDAVSGFVLSLVKAKKSASTIQQALAAVKMAHEFKHLQSPTLDAQVKIVVSSARRTVGVAPHKKDAVTPAVLRLMIDGLNLHTVHGLRDRAILLLGFAGAFRRSELAALTVDDFEQSTAPDGRKAYIVTVRKSKTDQEGAGMLKAIFTAQEPALDPVRAIDEYMTAAGVTDGLLFRRVFKNDRVSRAGISGECVADIVKESARRAGVILDLSGHSLRSGFITTTLENGATERAVMNQTGHKSVLVMRGYQRRIDVMKDNAASVLM